MMQYEPNTRLGNTVQIITWNKTKISKENGLNDITKLDFMESRFVEETSLFIEACCAVRKLIKG